MVQKKTFKETVTENNFGERQTVVYPYNGKLFSTKKEQTTDTWSNMGGSQRHYAEWKKPISKCYKWFDSIYMIICKKQEVKNREQIKGWQGCGWEEGFSPGDSTREF